LAWRITENIYHKRYWLEKLGFSAIFILWSLFVQYPGYMSSGDEKGFFMNFSRVLCAIFLALLTFQTFGADKGVRTVGQKGTVALTFDDGPNPIYTPQILAILKKYHVKATFFMVGVNAQKYPEVVKQVLAEGHAINTHTQTHPMLTRINNAQLEREVRMPSVIIQKITGKKPLCLRYPFGASNEHVRNVIRENGITPVPMGFNSFDYDRPGVDKIVNWVLKNCCSKQVILLHDGYAKREQTVAALPRIIEGIKEKGLGFSQICSDTSTENLAFEESAE
jgi:peptidoglycan/xylan/chitin deacetylase (PgdA/CDA1 family)